MAYDPVRARQRLIELGKSGPARLRGPVGRATRRFRGGYTGPLVSIVIPVSDDATTRIGACFDTVIVQTHRNLDVVVVPYGRHERVGDLVAARAAADWRIRVRRPAADLVAARHAGAEAARGELLLFVEAGDDLVPGGVEALVASHVASGSPLVVGKLQRPPVVGWIPDVPLEAAHLHERRGTDLAASPEAITDLALGNKLISRDLWRSAGLRFTRELPTGVDVVIALLQRAGRFDLITAETYVPTDRRDGVGVGTTVDVLAGLDDWLVEHRRIWRLVEAVGLPAVSAQWRRGDLGFGVQRLIADVERADDDQWRRLREHVDTVLESVSGSAADDLWRALGVEARIKTWLLHHGHRDALEDYLARRLFAEGSIPTVVTEGRVRALLPGHDDADLALPDHLFEMTEDETRLGVTLRDVRWTPQHLELVLTAAPEFVDLVEQPEVEVALVADDGTRLTAPVVRQFRDPRADLTRIEDREQDAGPGGVVVEVPLAALVEASSEASTQTPAGWRIEVTLRTQGLTRTGGVTKVDPLGSAGLIGRDHLAPRPVLHPDGAPSGAVLALVDRGTRLEVRPDDGPRLISLEVTGRRVHAVLRRQGDLPADARPVAVVAESAGLSARGELRREDDGDHVELVLPAARHGQRQWTLRQIDAAGRRTPVGWPATAAQWLAVGSPERPVGVVGTRDARGAVALLEAAEEFVVDDIVVDGAEALVHGRWLGGVEPAGAELVLIGPKAQLPGERTDHADHAEHADHADHIGWAYRFALATDPWGLGALPVPPAIYPVTLRGTSGTSGTSGTGGRSRIVPFGEAALDRAGIFSTGEVFSSRMVQFGRDANLDLQRPLADDERGPQSQARLQRWFATAEIPLEDDVVYLQSYLGASATDSQLAIHEELRRTRPDLRIHWGVFSSASRVPDDAVRVTMFSAEWYRVMGSARYLCLNIDPDRWFFRRPGQQVLQTFHGYPAKSMGLRMWTAKNYTPRRIALELARTSGQWDLILTPAPEMDVHYRREYAWEGPIHSHGYPRDDVLVGPDADRRRQEARERLGIAPHQKAVLYAPTWRDDLATNWREAEMVQHLDLAAAARQLGPDYVLLMRGHRFHSATARTTGGAAYLDVTDHPEINDLILASDAAVLDYSSLRFDFALTGRPMIFLVPDLDSYVGGVRGFLYDFRDSAPGPLVDTADEAVALLRDLPGLERRCADDLARFGATYNRLQTGDSARRVVEAFFGSTPGGAPEAAPGASPQ